MVSLCGNLFGKIVLLSSVLSLVSGIVFASFDEAKMLFTQNDYSAALAKFKQCLAEDKDNDIIKSYIDICENNIKWYKNKERIFIDVTRKEQDFFIKQEVELLVKLAIDYFNMSNYSAALFKFEKVLVLDPDNMDAQKYIRIIKDKNKQEQDNQENIIKIKQEIDQAYLQFKKDKVLFDAAKRLYLAFSYQDALNKFQQIKTKQINSQIVEFYIKLCQDHIERKQKEDIRYRKLLLDDVYQTAVGLYEKKKYSKALEKFNDVLIIDKGHKAALSYVKLCEEKIQLEYMLGKKTAEIKIKQLKVEKQVAGALEKQKEIDLLFSGAMDLYTQGLYDKVMSLLEKILKIDPENALAKSYVIRVKVKQEEKEKTEELFRYYHDVDIKLDEAKSFYDKGDYKVALSLFKEVLLMDITNKPANAYVKLCQKYIKIAEDKRMAEVKQGVLKIRDEARILYQQGHELYNNRQFLAAIEKFKAAWKIYPKLQEEVDVQKDIESAYRLEKDLLEKQKNAEIVKLYDEAMQYYKNKQYGRAYVLFNKINEKTPLYKENALYLKLSGDRISGQNE